MMSLACNVSISKKVALSNERNGAKLRFFVLEKILFKGHAHFGAIFQNFAANGGLKLSFEL